MPKPTIPRPAASRILLAAALASALAALCAVPAGADVLADDTRPSVKRAATDCTLPGRTGWTDEGSDTDYNQFLRPKGTLRTVMLFVDFPDAPAADATNGYADALTPAADWMWDASYGSAWLAITPVHRWLRMPQESTTYGFDRGITFEQHELYVKQAVAAADPYVDFSSYDLVYIVPTRNAAAVKFSPTYLWDPSGTGVVADGTRVKWAVTFGQDMWHWGFKVADHETGHVFGLPDLYAFTATDYHRFVGGWDVMGNISGPAPGYLAWHRRKFGWITEDQVVCVSGPGTRTAKLTAVEYPGGAKLAVIPTGPTTAYVVESRRKDGIDASACSAGALVYKVDSATLTGEGPVRVVNGNPGLTPPSGCTSLDMAAFRPGQEFSDRTAGVRIRVLSGDTSTDTVTITRTRATG